jgi:hypothetical protein
MRGRSNGATRRPTGRRFSCSHGGNRKSQPEAGAATAVASRSRRPQPQTATAAVAANRSRRPQPEAATGGRSRRPQPQTATGAGAASRSRRPQPEAAAASRSRRRERVHLLLSPSLRPSISPSPRGTLEPKRVPADAGDAVTEARGDPQAGVAATAAAANRRRRPQPQVGDRRRKPQAAAGDVSARTSFALRLRVSPFLRHRVSPAPSRLCQRGGWKLRRGSISTSTRWSDCGRTAARTRGPTRRLPAAPSSSTSPR